MTLENKIILVTGGSGLIGQAILNDIKKKGGQAINMDISVKTDIKNDEICFDITSNESIDNAIEIVMNTYDRIDGLVNNAYPRTKDWGNVFEDVSTDSFSKNVDMQLSRIFALIKPVSEQMAIQKQGSVVNISSIYGVVGNDFSVYKNTPLTSAVAYSAIKGGLINFTRYLASYFGRQGLRFNCVSPGGIFDNQNPTFVKQYEEKVPLGRMGKPEDIAPSVSFLLSDEAQYITGHNLIVDGGWVAI